MNITPLIRGLIPAGLWFAAVTPAVSAAIVAYDITSATSSTVSINATGLDTGMTATALTKGSDLGTDLQFNAVGGFGAVSWPDANSPQNNYFFQFEVAPVSGYTLTFSSLTYGLFRENGDQTQNTGVFEGPATWQLQYSLNGFTSAGITLATPTVALGADQTLNQATFTTSLSSIGTQAGPVTFRFYGYERTGSSAASYGGLGDGTGSFTSPAGYSWSGTGSDVLLSVNAAVPEPHHYAFVAGLGLLGFAAYRRLNQRTSKNA